MKRWTQRHRAVGFSAKWSTEETPMALRPDITEWFDHVLCGIAPQRCCVCWWWAAGDNQSCAILPMDWCRWLSVPMHQLPSWRTYSSSEKMPSPKLPSVEGQSTTLALDAESLIARNHPSGWNALNESASFTGRFSNNHCIGRLLQYARQSATSFSVRIRADETASLLGLAEMLF